MFSFLFRFRGTRVALFVVFAGFVALGGATAANAQGTSTSPTNPILTLAEATSGNQDPGAVTVDGENFTAGGRVYLAIYDQMGTKLFETRWVTASYASTYEPYWGEGQYGGTIVTPGGTLHETFDGLCGANVMVRARDEQTARWTNWLEVNLACADPDATILDSTTP